MDDERLVISLLLREQTEILAEIWETAFMDPKFARIEASVESFRPERVEEIQTRLLGLVPDLPREVYACRLSPEVFWALYDSCNLRVAS